MKILSTLLLACSVFLTACAQFTSEPPETKPHDFNWTTDAPGKHGTAPVGWTIAKARRIPDADIRSFIGRAGLTSGTEIAAVADLTRDLKKGGIWRKLYGFYPFVGNNATACAKNLISSKYSMTWTGTLTFTSGVTGDGVHYGDTGFALTQASSTNIHLYAWITANAEGPVFGTGDSSPATQSYLNLNGDSTFTAWGPNANFSVGAPFSGGNFLMERTNATKCFFVTDSFNADQDETLTPPSTNTVKVLAAVPGNIIIGTGTLRAFSFGPSLTYSEATNYFAIVNRFQTALGRGTP